jgi:FkbM family methyltransferase
LTAPPEAPERVLAEWRALAPSYDTTALQLIEPYVLEINLLGYDLRVLIPTRESQLYYDRVAVYSDLAIIRQLRMVPHGGVVFDVGAHQGVYSLVLANMAGPGGKVYAFEPFRLNAEMVRFNARLNGLPIEVFEMAIAGKPGHIRCSPAGARIDRSADDDVDVRLDTLDAFAHLEPDFIKMDIEGAEIDALGAAGRVLARRPNLHVEIHYDYYSGFGHTLDDLRAALPREGYFSYLAHPDRAITAYSPDKEICDYSALFFVREPPLRRFPPQSDVPTHADEELFHRGKLEMWRDIKRLNDEVASRDATIAWLHEEVGKRDRTVGWLHGEVAQRDAALRKLQSLLATGDVGAGTLLPPAPVAADASAAPPATAAGVQPRRDEDEPAGG